MGADGNVIPEGPNDVLMADPPPMINSSGDAAQAVEHALEQAEIARSLKHISKIIQKNVGQSQISLNSLKIKYFKSLLLLLLLGKNAANLKLPGKSGQPRGGKKGKGMY